MGIKTAAVYSEADTNALHVDMASDALAIGPAPAVESYLSVDAILAAIEESGADAVHPGYGFLSESAQVRFDHEPENSSTFYKYSLICL